MVWSKPNRNKGNSIYFQFKHSSPSLKILSLNFKLFCHKLSWSLGANRSILSKFHKNLKIPRRNSIKFYWISNREGSLNFHSKSTSNMKRFLWRKLLLSSNPSNPYFIWIFLSSGWFFLDHSKFEQFWNHLNQFKLI
jgi:hypothetical protein